MCADFPLAPGYKMETIRVLLIEPGRSFGTRVSRERSLTPPHCMGMNILLKYRKIGAPNADIRPCISRNDFIAIDLSAHEGQEDWWLSQFYSLTDQPIIALAKQINTHIGDVCRKYGAMTHHYESDIGDEPFFKSLDLVILYLHSWTQSQNRRTALDILVNQNPDGILILNEKKQIRFFNDRANSFFEGKLKLNQFLDIPISQTSDNEISMSLSDGSSCSFEIRIKEIVWEGQNCLLLAFHDVTKKRQRHKISGLANRFERLSSKLMIQPFIEAGLQELSSSAKGEIAWLYIQDRLYFPMMTTYWVKKAPLPKEEVKNFNCDVETLMFILEREGKQRDDGICFFEDDPAKGHPRFQYLSNALIIPIIKEKSPSVVFGVGNLKKLVSNPDYHNLIDQATVFWNVLNKKILESLRVRMHSAIEQAQEIIFIMDEDGVYSYVSPSFETITGWHVENILNKSNSEIQNTLICPQLFKCVADGLRIKDRWMDTFELQRKNGTKCYVEMDVAPVNCDGGGISGFVAHVRDVTQNHLLLQEREKIRKQLEGSQRLESIGVLAGGVAHDFNNMLTVILGYSEELKRHLPENSPQREAVGEILKAGNLSAELIRQLLAFSRKQTMNPTSLNLNSILTASSKFLQRIIGDHISIIMKFFEPLWSVSVDRNQIHQVLMNLVINARDAMPSGGTIVIQTSNRIIDDRFVLAHSGSIKGEFVEVSITDSGYGMDESTRQRIFEPFFTTKEVGKGTGLGLATVYGIIKQSNGYIWVESNINQGTEFIIHLPKQVVRQEGGILSEQEQLTIKGQSILIVEDDEKLRHQIAKGIQKAGAITHEASHGGDALMLIEKEQLKPDLILSDVVMPVISGQELQSRVKEKLSDIKFLFMSGYREVDLKEFDFFSFDQPFIQKPFLIKTLIKKINETLST